MSGLNFASNDSDSDDPEEYDEDEMSQGPEFLLFKQFGTIWPVSPYEGSQHTRAQKETCVLCKGTGWIWVLPVSART